MTDLIILGIVLLINLICAVVFAVWNRKKPEKWITLFFLILPVVGFLLYFFMAFAIKINEETAYYDRENLVASLEVPDEVRKPNVEDELSVVSIGDALSVGTNQEKRELILGQLKKEDQNSYKSILAASRDEDSETAHYVATAKVQAYEKTYATLRQAKTDYEDAKTLDTLTDLLQATATIVKSGVLSSAEQQLYRVEYCNLVDHTTVEEPVPKEYLDDYVDFLLELDRVDDLLRFWSEFQPNCDSEHIYFQIIGVFYERKDQANFYATLKQVRNSKIALSTEGLSSLRFWMK